MSFSNYLRNQDFIYKALTNKGKLSEYRKRKTPSFVKRNSRKYNSLLDEISDRVPHLKRNRVSSDLQQSFNEFARNNAKRKAEYDAYMANPAGVDIRLRYVRPEDKKSGANAIANIIADHFRSKNLSGDNEQIEVTEHQPGRLNKELVSNLEQNLHFKGGAVFYAYNMQNPIKHWMWQPYIERVKNGDLVVNDERQLGNIISNDY